MAQHDKGKTMTHEQAVTKLNELIKDIPIAMLTTVDTDGALRSRPMATQKMGPDGVLWFFTSADSPKAAEVGREHHVNIAYADQEHNRYVSVSGAASVVRDEAKAKELWNPFYKAWFPEGLDDPKLALLRVAPDKAEYWDSPGSMVVHAIGFAKAVLTGKPYDGGENEKLKL